MYTYQKLPRTGKKEKCRSHWKGILSTRGVIFAMKIIQNFKRVVRARYFWEAMHMLLTNIQYNTTRQYVGSYLAGNVFCQNLRRTLDIHNIANRNPVQNTCWVLQK